ncbi:hypothetical protein GS894_11530 [Rhodococcus hoagii]|nr:hypothetical protein [Prescottella equi]MBM4537301.1 hypothetical protein [Prescottella equi]MBM4686283.1 hypothetical protein [Prescottella equi]NKR83182.1 hypothetical protein [Prescottella equi]NKR86801.1 hypothetical protein [Prescottella equi]
MGPPGHRGTEYDRSRTSYDGSSTTAALRETLPTAAVDTINDCSLRGRASAVLTSTGERRWRLGSASGVDDALGVIDADAIDVITGERDGRLALCASPTCRAAFFDTSRSRTRRW